MHSSIGKLLVESGGYADLKDPVILSSGELGIYYVNAEKLLQDGGEFRKYGNDSGEMIGYAVRQYLTNSSFREIIQVISDEVWNLFPEGMDDENIAISGGQKRDWLFSGPVAHELDIGHVSLYKDGTSYMLPGKKDDYSGLYVVHVSDLLTKGSSAYDAAENPPAGWIPVLREGRAEVENLAAVVTRNQGGEENLKKAGVGVTSFVSVDEDFLRAHSAQPETAVSYFRNPRGWSEGYIRERGIEAFASAFSPENLEKDRRSVRFLNVYSRVLAENGMEKYERLRSLVDRKFGIDIDFLESE